MTQGRGSSIHRGSSLPSIDDKRGSTFGSSMKKAPQGALMPKKAVLQMVQDVKSDLSSTIQTELRAVCSAVVEKDLKDANEPDSVKEAWSAEATEFVPFGSMGRVFLLEKAMEKLTTKVDAAVSKVNASAGAHHDFINTYVSKIDHCEAVVSEFSTKIDSTLASLVEELDQNSQRDLIVQATVDQQLQNLNEMKARMAAFESRMASLDAAFVTAKKAADDTRESHEGARRAHEEAVEAQQRWREESAADWAVRVARIEALDAAAAESAQRLAALEASCAGLLQQATDTAGLAASHAERLEGANARLGALEAATAAAAERADADAASAEARVAAADANREKVTAELLETTRRTQDHTLAVLTARVDTLDTSVPALEAADAAKASGLEALDAARARIEAELAAVAQALRGEAGELAAVRSRVAHLARLEPAQESTLRQVTALQHELLALQREATAGGAEARALSMRMDAFVVRSAEEERAAAEREAALRRAKRAKALGQARSYLAALWPAALDPPDPSDGTASEVSEAPELLLGSLAEADGADQRALAAQYLDHLAGRL